MALCGLLCCTLLSCGSNYHLKRSKYHLSQAIAKGAVIKSDTVFKDIEVITQLKVYDTLVRVDQRVDTLFIRNTKYSVKLKYDTISKTQYVQLECKPDTIRIKVPVQVATVITPYNLPKWIYIAGILAILIILILSANTLKRK